MFVGCINYLDNIYYFILSLAKLGLTILYFYTWFLDLFYTDSVDMYLLFDLYFSLTLPSKIYLLICGEGRREEGHQREGLFSWHLCPLLFCW